MEMFYETIPADLRQQMYVWLDKNSAAERKPDMTDEQFYYKARKNALGPFKSRSTGCPPRRRTDRCRLALAVREAFSTAGVKDTRQYVDKFVKPVRVAPDMKSYLGKEVSEAMADDLQDSRKLVRHHCHCRRGQQQACPLLSRASPTTDTC